MSVSEKYFLQQFNLDKVVSGGACVAGNLIKEYVAPTRIIDSHNACNAEMLLAATQSQAHMEYFPITSFDNGYVVLDFGKELCGGIRIVCRSAASEGKARIRFGESVGECNAQLGEKGACNDHSVRDFVVDLSSLSDQEWGKTGFRFVRLDFMCKAEIVGVYAASTRYYQLPQGNFCCDDKLINDIYDTAAYTVYLNMQEYIFDGIKRDRLIWVGDMQPEVSAITYLYGQNSLVEKTLKEAIAHNPMPCWIVAMPTYSFWLMCIVEEYFRRTGNRQFALECLPYLEKTLDLFNGCIGNNSWDFSSVVTVKNPFFVDWPTSASKDEQAGGKFIFRMGILAMQRLYGLLGLPVNSTCDEIIKKLDAQSDNDVCEKSVVALGYLTGQISAEEAAKKLAVDGANGLTTFMSYYILSAVADCCGIDKATEMLKEYYGAMLQRGSTTFWENFNLSWLEGSGAIDEITPEGQLDLHGDFGEYCYKGFRHSLCHGWSCGAVQFLTERVLGVNYVNSHTLVVEPNLGKLKKASGIVPTSAGNVSVDVTNDGGYNLTITFACGKVVSSRQGKVTINLHALDVIE